MAAPTSIGDSIGGIWDAITGPASSIAEGISFASDPLGWWFGKTQDALDGLVSRLLPWLMSATKPDLTADWFLRNYAVSFGLAIMVWLLILLGRLVAVAKGRASGGDLIELLTTRSVTFIGGAMWGPALGWVIVGIFHALSEGLLGLFSQTTEGALATLLAMVRDGDWKGVPGGLVFATGLLVCMLIALTLVVIMLVVAMVALYLSGVIFPLGWVWITDDPSRRPIATRLAWTWLGLNASHPLMFLLLGSSFAFIASMVPMSSDPGIKLLTNGITAVIVMAITAMSPVLLFRFAPVLPTNAGQSSPSFHPSGGSDDGYGTNDLSRVADDQAAGDDVTDEGAGNSTGGGTSAGGTSSGGAEAGGGGQDPGPLETEAMNAGSSDPAGSGAEGDSAAEGAASGSFDDPVAGVGESPIDAAAAPSTDGGGASTPIGATSTDQAAAGASEGAEVGEAAEAAGAAGAAESSTGVGAVIGIPTLIAAAGMEAASKAADYAGDGADMAASDMDENQTQGSTR